MHYFTNTLIQVKIMVNIDKVSFKYGNNTVLNNISINLTPGNIYGLLGRNGVGKTTLLKLMGGLIKPQSGSCQIFGETPFNRSPKFLDNIYYLPEDCFTPEGTIERYVNNRYQFYSKFDLNKFFSILYEMKIDSKKQFKALSYGDKKKIMISFALSTNCDLILLDEPTNGLDIPSKSIFRKLLTTYCSDESIIVISTHQVRDLENIIDPIIIMSNKEILLNHSTYEIGQFFRFNLYSKKISNALYCQELLGGYLTIEENLDKIESNVNIEALFNGYTENEDAFKSILKY